MYFYQVCSTHYLVQPNKYITLPSPLDITLVVLLVAKADMPRVLSLFPV